MKTRLIALVLFALTASAVSLLTPPQIRGQDKKGAPPAVPATYPTLTTPLNVGIKPGTATELVFTGTNLADATGVWTSCGAKVTIPDGQKDATKLKVKLDIPVGAKPGLHAVRVATKAGISNLRPLCIDDFSEVAETDKNKTKAAPQVVPVPCVVTGKAETESSDFFKFPVQAGKPITVEVLARRLGSPLDPVILLYDGTGKELGGVYADDTPGLQSDSRLTITPKTSGELIVEVRDTTYRGGADYVYRLRIGHFPGATTAFPLAVERGKTASIGFSGPGIDAVKPVTVTAPTDPAATVLYVTPELGQGTYGWPVPVLISDWPESVEKEPNNDPAKANRLPVPGGISARFAEKNDVDHFVFAGKKGTKYVVQALTYEVNSPAEVYIRVLDAKGAELAKSNPQQAPRIEYTPAADGDFTLACEHVNYASGPNEVYHLSVAPAAPDFTVTVGLDRLDVPAGAVGLLPITGLTKVNGFAAPIELTVVGEGLSGSLTLPAAANPQPATPVFLAVTAKASEKPGPRSVLVKATAKIDGKDAVRYGSVAEITKAALGGLGNPPAEFTNRVALSVSPEPPFTLSITLDKGEVAAGATLKGKIVAKRAKDFAEEIQLAQVSAPANVTAKLKPIAKGAADAEFELAPAANAAVGAGTLILRGTAKVGGKDVTVIAVPKDFTITAAPKKEEPKKDEPKKEKK